MKLYHLLTIGLFFGMMSCGSDATQDQTSESESQVTENNDVPVKPSRAQVVNNTQSTETMDWLSIEEATKLNEENPKPFLVDVYTDWCGWCKVMDRKTFSDPEIQAYIQDNFYPVKFNAEQREDVKFNGQTWEFVPGGRRGHNKLASFLLNGRLGYPSFAFLNSKYEHLHITVGYKNPQQFMGEMKKAISKNM